MDGGIDLDLPTLLPSFSSTQIILYFILPSEATEYFQDIAKAPKWKKKIWLQKRAAKSKKCPHYHGAQESQSGRGGGESRKEVGDLERILREDNCEPLIEELREADASGVDRVGNAT